MHHLENLPLCLWSLTTLLSDMSTLAQFIYQHLSPSQRWTRSQPPTLPWVNLDQSIPLVNQANLSKPHFPLINPYLHVPHSSLPNIYWQVPLYYSSLGQMENPEDTNCIHHDITNNFPYYPEEFYVSSVLPTCTPKRTLFLPATLLEPLPPMIPGYLYGRT